ncbi:MAG: HAMP domain-containing histidine kinase [Anaerolinea sp.]|nr:HAMP domain-containing histidine kinase [Anaerolinea sp.]
MFQEVGCAPADSLLSQVRQVMSSLHVVTYAQLTPELVVTFAAPDFSEALSAPVVEIAGQRLPDLLWEFAAMEGALTAVWQQETPIFTLERVNRARSDGRSRYFNFHVTRLQEPAFGLLFVAEDVTVWGTLAQTLIQERNDLSLLQSQLMRANEKLQQLDQMKTLFLSMAAHDLRTPLTAIMGYAELLQQSDARISVERRHGYLSVIRAQADRINRLVDDILNVDQIERGLLRLDWTEGDVNALVREIADILSFLMAGQRQTLQLNLAEGAIMVRMDVQRMQQVLYNLLSNAIKYTPGGGQITVVTRREGDTAVLEIADTGLGMTPEQIVRLFELYYRTDEARERKILGTGLGLFIVRSLVEAHGGRVSVQSAQNVGTVFTVWLPLAPSSPLSDGL